MPTATRPPIDLTVVCIGSRWRVLLRGELDLHSGEDLLRVGAVLASAGASAVDLDLGEVTFVDTAGWRALCATRRLVVDAGGEARVVVPGPGLDRLLGHLAGDRSGGGSSPDLVTVG